MKALFNRKSMLDAFALASTVAPTRTPRPILQNVLLRADPEGSMLLATDLEVGVHCRALGVKVDQPGSVVLPTQRFGQILRASGDEELSVEVDGDNIHIRGQHAQFKLPSEDPDLFPDVPDFAAESFHGVSAADLRRAIRRTVFATDVESTRYALGGVLFEMADGTLTLVGTDGRCLARQVIGVEAEGNVAPPAGQPVVPVKALKLLERCIDDDDPPVHLAFDGTRAVLIRTDRATIHGRLVEGRFPEYQRIFPGSHRARVPLDVCTFLHGIWQAAVVTSEESRGVDFTFGDDQLRLTGQAPDLGSSEVVQAIDHAGEPIEVTFDPRYLTDMLKTLDENATIHAELIDAKSAVVFRSEDDYSYVVMPMSRE